MKKPGRKTSSHPKRISVPETFPAFVPHHLSHSQIDGYQRCAFWYFLRYVEKVEEAQNFYAGFGSLVHELLEEDGLYQLNDHRQLSENGLIRRYKRAFNQTDIPWPDQRTKKRYYERGLDMMSAYANDRRYKTVAVEHRFSITLKALPMPITGVIDRIREEDDGALVITDYKTGSPYSNKDLKTNKQLTLYAIACKMSYGEWPGAVEYYFLKTDDRIQVRRGKQHVLDLIQTCRQVLKGMKKGSFRQHCEDKWWCGNICGYGISGLCPVQPQ